MATGFGFDILLAIALIIFSSWEAVVALRTKSVKRIRLVVLALGMAGVLLWLRWPQWWPH